jgi:hypothetical protein
MQPPQNSLLLRWYLRSCLFSALFPIYTLLVQTALFDAQRKLELALGDAETDNEELRTVRRQALPLHQDIFSSL